MIELEVLKKVIDTLPISGDIVEIIEDKKIIYESGRELPIDTKTTKLSVEDKVRCVTHEFISEKNELFIGLDHYTPSGLDWNDTKLDSILIRIQRNLKLEKLGWIK
jgi:hypothetical protein